MTIYYCDPSASDGGSGTIINPYSPADAVTAFNAWSGDVGGDSLLFKTGTIALLPDYLNAAAYNWKLGYYGTGDKPILCSGAVKTGTWTNYSGNVWSISHTRWDAFYLGAQLASGLVTQTNPEGSRLTAVDTIAHCEEVSLSQFWDSGTNTMYVNLDGLDPRDEAITYSLNAYVLRHYQQDASLELDGIRGANAWDCNFFFNFNDGADGLIVTDLETHQGMAQAAINQRSNFQIIGGSTTPLTGVEITRFKSTAGMIDSLDFLYVDGAQVSDFEIDGCGQGLGLWTQVTNSRFSGGRITNLFAQHAYWYSIAAQNTGMNSYGIYAPPVEAGVDGDSYGNRLEGILIANTYHSQIHIQTGGSWVFDHCTLVATAQQSNAYGNGTNGGRSGQAVFMERNQTYTNSHVDAVFSNCIVVAESTRSPYLMIAGDTYPLSVKGDRNAYYLTGGTNFHAVLNPSSSRTVYSSWATYQAAAAAVGLDANSVYEQNIAYADLPFVNPGSFITDPYNSSNGARYLSGYDFTPQSVEDGYTDSAAIRLGEALWLNANTPPTLNAGDLTEVAGGTQPGTYYVKTAWVGENGETLPSSEQSLAIVTNLLQVAAPGSPPAWATGWNVYVGTATGVVYKQNTAPIDTATAWTMAATGLVSTSHAKAPQTLAPSRTSAVDADMQPFPQNVSPDAGAYQHSTLTDPRRQRRSSGARLW